MPLLTTENSSMPYDEIRQIQKEIVQVLLKHTDDLEMAKVIIDELNLNKFARLKDQR